MSDGWYIDNDAITHVVPALVGGVLAAVTGVFFAHKVLSVEVDPKKVETIKIANLIAEGADAFLKAEYAALSAFVVVVAALVAGIVRWEAGVTFVIGAFLSASCGYMGMKIATKANIRTTVSCEGPDGLNNGLQVAFRSGAVMALSVVSTGLLGVACTYLIFDHSDPETVWQAMSGFAFGASSIALFARVGGGIYTKAADVGADLVGKVEEDLAEDSPDNPATIADNVGDNVGDVAGMGADLFESFVGSIIAAATLGFSQNTLGGLAGSDRAAAVALPFWIAGTGAFCSIVGCFLIRASPQDAPVAETEETKNLTGKEKIEASEKTLESLLGSIRIGIWGASILVLATSAVSVCITFGPDHDDAWRHYGCIVIGLVCGNLIGYFTEYATSYTYGPTQSIAYKSDTGPATVIIQGLGVGMLSTVPPVAFIVMSILGTYYLSGTYGIAISAVGMLATLGVTLATDAYGPVADNAGGIAEMAPDSEVSSQVRDTTDALDALGNTTAATGKGFAIGSAVLTALALMNAFALEAKLGVVNVLDPVFLPGVLVGSMLPFVFAALTMLSVGKAAESIMWECRDQLNKKHFENMPLDPQKCVKISTFSSLIEMVIPGSLACFMPLIIGQVLGARGLLGLLTGAISSGFLLGVTMANAGGAWDNAKKWVEKAALGEDKKKGSSNHHAVVVGDTVGDPFKDTSGPALNILIKLMSVVSLVIAPELDTEPWENWYQGTIIFVLLMAFYTAFVYYVDKFAALHDRPAIDAASKKRKGGAPASADAADVAPTAVDAATV